MEGLIHKIKEFLGKKDYLYLCILAGILMLIITWPMENKREGISSEEMIAKEGELYFTGSKDKESESAEQLAVDEKGQFTEAEYLARKLEELLFLTDGVGQVKVMITLKQRGEKIVEKDKPSSVSSIIEEDASGGKRETSSSDTSESTVFYTDETGRQIPVIITETLPQIEGITVVCEGGGYPEVQKNITYMIQALFDVEVHKIRVVKMKPM